MSTIILYVIFIQDNREGDYLNLSSSEGSCAEEIEDDDNSDPHSTSSSPPKAGAEGAPPDLNNGDGIVLQFAKIKSNHPKTRSQIAKDESLVQLSPSSTVSLSSVKLGDTAKVRGENAGGITIKHGARGSAEQGVEWMESEPSQTSLATRSLSAVKRKEQHKKSMDDGGTCGVDEVLEALKYENESLTSLHANIPGDKVGGMKQTSETSDHLKNSSSVVTTELEERESRNVTESATPRIKGALLPSLPFRPVLVNRYKQATVTTKTLARPRDVAVTTAVPLAREEGCTTTALHHRQPQESSEIGEREIQHEVVRESLTEQTVKIITDKVRQMDAR